MSGRVVHFEIPFDDGDRARAFYRDAFGWQLQEWDEGAYTLVSTGPSGEQGPEEPGFVNGGMMRRENPGDGPIVVIDVEDIDAALARIEELGGQTLLGRQPVGEMGWAAYFKDVEGNSMGLWQTAR
ncbi:VOC family protein [Nocardioides sp.]|uniref:VOC family protein n=1 Tax=Nocardioides sp. TaxID=35761 RepID=UPI002D808868|nr:VOC family protein [Nocardioides sp.]HET8961738.1 VOC family protein [Nocardioides sp.]